MHGTCCRSFASRSCAVAETSAINIRGSEKEIEDELYSMLPMGTSKAEVRSALKSRLGLDGDAYDLSADYRKDNPRWNFSFPLPYGIDYVENIMLYYGRDPRIKRDEQGRLMEDEQGWWVYDEGEGLPVYSWFRVVLGKHRPLSHYFVRATVTALFLFDKDDRLNKIVVRRSRGVPVLSKVVGVRGNRGFLDFHGHPRRQPSHVR